MKAEYYLGQKKKIQVQNFLDKFWQVSFIYFELEVTGIEKILGPARNCRRWSGIEVAKLPEIILSTVM